MATEPDSPQEQRAAPAPSTPQPAAAATTPAAGPPGSTPPKQAAAAPSAAAAAPAQKSGKRRGGGMTISADQLLQRLVSTAGIIGVGVALGAILVSQNVAGWITGLVVSIASIVLTAIVWGQRRV